MVGYIEFYFHYIDELFLLLMHFRIENTGIDFVIYKVLKKTF